MITSNIYSLVKTLCNEFQFYKITFDEGTTAILLKLYTRMLEANIN